MHVVIVGGGIGGLTLAHGLRRQGIEVSVHERDATPSDRWEGYRIHIDPIGHRALHACLPDAQWRAFLATSAVENGITFLTEELEELMVLRWEKPEPEDHGVDRPVLRRILLSGLGDSVRYGAEFVRYENEDDGRVTAVFADGHRATGDVLVGADGAGSRVRRQLLPDAGRHETGAVGIGHKVFLDDDDDDGGRRQLPPALTRGMSLTNPDQPAMLFTACFVPPDGVAERLGELGITDAPTVRPYVLAALVAERRAFAADPVELDAPALDRAVERFVAGWHPDLRRVFAAADADARQVQVFRASTPTPAWVPSRVTLLGDAIHQMPPVGGMGGNTALRDAATLAVALGRAGADPVGAIGGYEQEMRSYAYPIVASALAQQRQTLAHGALRTGMTRTAMRAAGRSPRLRGLMARRRPRPTWRPEQPMDAAVAGR